MSGRFSRGVRSDGIHIYIAGSAEKHEKKEARLSPAQLERDCVHKDTASRPCVVKWTWQQKTEFIIQRVSSSKLQL